MIGHIGMGAVIDIETRVQSPKAKVFGFTGSYIGRDGSSARTSHSMEIDTVVMQAGRIIGEGEMGTTLRDLARAMGVQDKIEFLGHVPHKELPQYYNWAHILLHTSLHEAQGVVIAEAASSGVLVAGTRTGLIADFGETMAVQSTVSDFKTLADKILDAASQPEKYNAMRGKALQWANQHDADWTFRQYSTLYDSL